MRRYILTIFLQCLFLNLSAQEFKVDTLLFNGPGERRINYVMLGDGYRASELPRFIRDSEGIMEDLFEASPFAEYKNYFNVFAISVPSNVSGAARDPNELIDNYFGSTFNFAGIDRLLVPTKTDRVSAVLASNFPAYDQVFVLVNDSKYGGSGGWIATSSTNTSASEVSIHEIGHSFGNLSDEYWAGEQYAFESPNMTQVASKSLVKWKNWIDDFGIGIVPHPEDNTWYKPHENCKMQFLGVPFCAVCKEQLIRNIQGLVSVMDSYSPVGANELSDDMNFELSLIQPNPNTLEVTWLLDEEQIAIDVTQVNLSRSELEGAPHILEAVIIDATLLDRKDRVQVTTVHWEINGFIASQWMDEQKDRKERGEVITSITKTSGFSFKTFPNPVQNSVTIEYTMDQPGPMELTLLNLKGEQLQVTTLQALEPGSFSHDLDLTKYENGLYVLQYKSGNFQRRIKVVKVE